jgi:hypothetical protein
MRGVSFEINRDSQREEQVMNNRFISSGIKEIEILKPNGKRYSVPTELIYDAILRTHTTLDKFRRFEEEDGVNVFELLGMRNLSAFIGEIFVSSLEKCFGGQFLKNPHQDGYPDLLLLDNAGRIMMESLRTKMKDKKPFSGFENGGIEIKATCGSLPTPAIFEKKGMEKPGMGDERINHMANYDWKAHHRDTNNLLGILWDFVDRVPKIVCVFFSSQLNQEDWGAIVQPRDGGGRTTSVSIMSKPGIYKMYEGWLFCRSEARYYDKVDKINKSDLISSHFKEIYLP